ncbi:MAG: Trm112 family protein [Nanohaloarchaea archaeon]|nr:Trm112 family protein [Candidatus Nanohaloarchaea archaeon]
MVLKKDLFDMLACPKCKGDVSLKGTFILCGKCKLAYPVLDSDVPDMLIDDAWALSKAEKAGFKHNLKL